MTQDKPLQSLFQFKQFSLLHGEGRSWKVGTDSILLGSWCSAHGLIKALDIGTGAGILALMLAQRNSNVLIDAVELSHEAVQDARRNIAASPWKARITLIESNILEFILDTNALYDLVICNPPYYPEHLSSPSEDRRSARQGSHGFSIWTLPFIAAKLVHPEGKLSVVLPASAGYHFIELSNENGLFVNRRLNVRHSKNREVSMVLLEMGCKQMVQSIDELILFDEQRATQNYMTLCSEFIRVGH